MQDLANTLIVEGKPRRAASEKKRGLVARFCLVSILLILLLVAVTTAIAFVITRDSNIQADHAALIADLDAQLGGSQSAEFQKSVFDTLSRRTDIRYLSVWNANYEPIWLSESASPSLSSRDREVIESLRTDSLRSQVAEPLASKLGSFSALVGKRSPAIISYTKLRNDAGQVVAFAQLLKTYDDATRRALRSAALVALLTSSALFVLFIALFASFRRGLKTIEQQEDELNAQIARLSDLLASNKHMQKSMKTASSRAVEMNEQFLRRLGSELHDGPAQAMGYASMRLNGIAELEQTKSLSAEFHTIREALDGALEEIRGISRGLVLPELQHMTLEEALNTVVKLHTRNSDAQVKQYYNDLPNDIPLPIKIMSYRFVQEGLNNAHRHGQAEKCRVSAFVKNNVLNLSLKDNGLGFRKSLLNSDDGHLGLMGLKDRVESLGGRFSINSELGVGTALKAEITLNDDAGLAQ